MRDSDSPVLTRLAGVSVGIIRILMYIIQIKRGSRKIESIDREESQSASPSAHELLQPIITVSQLRPAKDLSRPASLRYFARAQLMTGATMTENRKVFLARARARSNDRPISRRVAIFNRDAQRGKSQNAVKNRSTRRFARALSPINGSMRF